jgi:hypothetical protein
MVSLYAKTKLLILQAEEMDTALCSNIAIVKEQRDALDHLMRAIGDCYANNPNGDEYRTKNIDKAIGHIFRSAYDALDSLAISLKIKINDAMQGHTNDAISSVIPRYYSEHCACLDEINVKITESRNCKDVGNITVPRLDSYMKFVTTLLEIKKDCEKAVPGMVEFDRKKRREDMWATVREWGFWILLTIFGTWLFFHWPSK